MPKSLARWRQRSSFFSWSSHFIFYSSNSLCVQCVQYVGRREREPFRNFTLLDLTSHNSHCCCKYSLSPIENEIQTEFAMLSKDCSAQFVYMFFKTVHNFYLHTASMFTYVYCTITLSSLYVLKRRRQDYESAKIR